MKRLADARLIIVIRISIQARPLHLRAFFLLAGDDDALTIEPILQRLQRISSFRMMTDDLGFQPIAAF